MQSKKEQHDSHGKSPHEKINLMSLAINYGNRVSFDVLETSVDAIRGIMKRISVRKNPQISYCT